MSSAGGSSYQNTKELQANLVPLQPLDLQAKQIRILRLLPGQGVDPIRCELYLAHLGNRPYYEALSYVWGDPKIVRPIFLDGRQVRVTENLEAALRSLRLGDETRNMWVDALCINQADDVEKTHQVHLMAQIYKETALALLWLGSMDSLASTDSEEGHPGYALDSDTMPMTTYRRLLSAYYDETPRTRIDPVDAANAFELIRKIAGAGEDHHFEDDESPGEAGGIKATRASRVGLERLMCLSWWNRIWTVQEAVLPRKAIAFCGSLQLDWSTFVKAQRNLDRHYSKRCCIDHLLSVDGFRHMSLVDFASRVKDIDICRKSTLGLVEALTVHCARLAGDPRDMLYALLGLNPDWTTALSEIVDYSLPAHQTFCKMTMELIRLTKSLEPLIRLRYRSKSRLLPTWVHDLSAPWRACFRSIAFRYNLYDASGGREPCVEFIHERELISRGTLVDEIEREIVAYDFDEKGISPQVNHGWIEFLNLGDARSRSRPYPTGGSLFEACKNLVSELIQNEVPWDDGNELSKLGEQDYASWWATMGTLDYTSILGTKLFVTKKGLMGQAHQDVRVGDSVHVLFGGNVPFVLRPVKEGQDKGCYTYLGHCYVQGIMNGEAVKDIGEGESFTII